MSLTILLSVLAPLAVAQAIVPQLPFGRRSELPREPGHSWPYRPPAAVAPDGDRLALVMPGPRLVVVDVVAGRVGYETSLGLRSGEESRATSLDWSPGGERLAVQYSTGEVQVLDARTGSLEREFTRRAGPAARGWARRAVGWIDDEQLLATHGDGPLDLWCVECGELVRAFEPLGGPTSALALSPDRELLAVGDHSGGVAVWRVRDGELVGRTPPEGVRVNGLDFDAHGTRLAVALHSVEAVVWSLEDWSELARVSHADKDVFGDLEVGRVALSPSGRLLATSSSSYWEVRVWGLEDGRERWRYDYRGGNPGFMSVSFSDDGRRVLMGLRGVVADARTGAIQETLAPSNDVHTWVQTSGDLAWIYYANCLRVWSLADPELAPCDIEVSFRTTQLRTLRGTPTPAPRHRPTQVRVLGAIRTEMNPSCDPTARRRVGRAAGVLCAPGGRPHRSGSRPGPRAARFPRREHGA